MGRAGNNVKRILVVEETSRPFLPKLFTPDRLRAIVRAVLGLNQVVLGKQCV